MKLSFSVTPLFVLLRLQAHLLSNQQGSVSAFTAKHRAAKGGLAAAVVNSDSEWYSPPPPPPVSVQQARRRPAVGQSAVQTSIQTEEEFEAFLNESKSDDRLVVIKFYASWCKSCAKFGMKFDQFASEYGDHIFCETGELANQGKVRIATVEYGVAKEICIRLGIKSLPTVQMYLPKSGTGNGSFDLEKVQDFPCPPGQFTRVRDLTKAYLDQQTARRKEVDFDKALSTGHELMMKQTLNTKTIKKTEKAIDMAQQLEAMADHAYANAATAAKQQPKKSLWGRLRRKN